VTGALLAGGLLAVAVLLLVGGLPRVRRPTTLVPLRIPWRRNGSPAAPPVVEVPLVCDLLAAATTAGLAPGPALGSVLDALSAAGFADEPELRRIAARLTFGGEPEEVLTDLAELEADRWQALAEPLRLSVRTGAPAASLLSSAAGSARARRRWESEAAAAG
jgi:Flp pilus assembly protein TadB